MISVIIPLYNKRDSILRSIRSVLNQTFSDFELIIINDGSTDGSVEIIKTEFSDARIKIISQPNGGVSKARNHGAQVAQGEWLAYLDADDYWLPKYLEVMYETVLKYPNAMVIGCASYIQDCYTGKILTNHMIDAIYGRTVEMNYFIFPDIMSHIGATLIKRNAFIQTKGFDEQLKNNEDIFLLGSLTMNNQYIFVGKMLHVYSIGIVGQVTRNPLLREKFAKDTLYVINKLYYQYQNNPINPKVISALKFRFRDFLLRHLKNKNKAMVIYYIDNLCPEIKDYFIPLEWIKMPKFRKLAILYIQFTKVCWRMRGIQSRSHKSRYHKELVESFKRNPI